MAAREKWHIPLGKTRSTLSAEKNPHIKCQQWFSLGMGFGETLFTYFVFLLYPVFLFLFF